MRSFGTYRCCASRRQRIEPRYQKQHPDIDWRSIAGMRNVLVHDYFEVDFETVWQIVDRDIKPLELAMRAIAATMDEQGLDLPP